MATTLVLCSETDLAALWAWRGLRELGAGEPMLVTAALLASAISWHHEIDGAGANARAVLADGRVLDSREIGGVLNRLTHLPLRTAGASTEDRAYAEQEWSAFSLSWLHALPGPMLNRPSPLGLSGHERTPAAWTLLAQREGLPVVPIRHDGASQLPQTFGASAIGTSVIAVDRALVGAPTADEAWQDACRRFAAASGCGLLGIDFVLGADGAWRFAGATTMPDLRAGGMAVLRALAAALRTA